MKCCYLLDEALHGRPFSVNSRLFHDGFSACTVKTGKITSFMDVLLNYMKECWQGEKASGLIPTLSKTLFPILRGVISFSSAASCSRKSKLSSALSTDKEMEELVRDKEQNK